MGKLFCLIGPSSSGKDTIYKKIMQVRGSVLEKVIPYTTRPIRDGEKDGIQYYFKDENSFQKMKSSGGIIEDREYSSYYGIWRYFTADDGQIDLRCHSYLIIATIQSFRKFKDYFGNDNVLPLYISLDPGIRLQRALDREKDQESPMYEEMCRRFIADSSDFCEENIIEAGIKKSFDNIDLDHCVNEIIGYIDSCL